MKPPPINELVKRTLIEGIAPPAEMRTAYDQLAPTERAFVDEYVASDDPRGAAIRAWPKKAGEVKPNVLDTRALDFMKRPLIQAAIAERMAAAMDRLEISADRILREVAKIAFSNIGDYVRITAEGEPYVDLSDVNSDQLAAVAEVTVEDFKDGRGDEARDVKRVKFKLHDKLNGLDKLMRYRGLYAPEKLEVTGKGGAPIKTVNVNVEMTAAEAAEVYARELEGNE